MTLAGRNRRPSYADVCTPGRNAQNVDADNKSNVKVVVRIRPENGMEKSGNFRIVVKAMNEHVLVFDPNEQSSPEYGYHNRHQRRDIRKRKNKDLKFAFDYVFDHGSLNHEIYQQTTKKILDSFLQGYNCSVFAYGATGAGKTHTMLGNPDKPGVMYLTMMDLYNRIGDMEGNTTCDIAVSYLEVYNEQIRDLLMGGKILPVREDPQNGVVVPGLSLHKPRDADELLHMLHYGNKNRTQHPTDANAESSRSHAVFQVFVRQRDRTANISAEVKVAKLCLVDLAGSERATVTKNRGTRFREGANINRSLLALGNVINALADPKYKGHVPYRDSKLTRLLKDSLGGNCQTVMIAAVSPSSMTYEDTYNTLKYADRAKNIQSNLKKNVLNVDFHVARYGQIVEELRKEIVELKDKLRCFEEGKLVQTVTVTNSIEICRIKEKLDGVFVCRLKLCREFLDAELKSRDLEWRIHRKKKCLARMALICDSNAGIAEKIKKMVASSRHRLHSFHSNRDTSMKHLIENKKSVAELEDNIKSHCNSSGDNLETENLKMTLQIHQKGMALTESQYCVKYLTKVVKTQEREIQSTERMMNCLLHLVRKQHFIIKGSNMMTSDLEAEYTQIQTMAEGREVSFADQTFNAGNQSFSLTGLLDFQSLPSGMTLDGQIKPTESLLVQISDNIQPTKNVNEYTDIMNSCLKSTSAGHTPFPNKSIMKNLHNSMQAKSTCDAQLTQTIIPTNLKIEVSGEQNRECLEQSKYCNVIIDKCTPGSFTNGVHCKPNEPLNSTFTVDDNNVEEQNATFTLMETSDKDPEIIARTPVIGDKFFKSSDNYSVPNIMLEQNVETYTKQVVNTCTVNVNAPVCQLASNEFVNSSCNSMDSASQNVQYLSHHGCPSGYVLLNPLCDRTVLQSYGSVTETQSHNNFTENVTASQSQNNFVTNVNVLHHGSNIANHVNDIQSQCHVSVDAIRSQAVNNCIQNRANSLVQNNGKSPNASLASLILRHSPAPLGILSQTITKSCGNIITQGPSQTVTKEQSDFFNNRLSEEVKHHAVRSITFGGVPCTPESVKQVKSYAQAVQTPPMLRTPLREMNSNTPLSEQNQGRQVLNNKLTSKRGNLFGDNTKEIKETSKKLNELGLPSLMERWHTDPRKPRNQSSHQPNYMQPTKAVRYRSKSKCVNNENMEPSRVPLNHNNRNKNFKRSQSVTSVSRPGWQI